MGEGKSTGLIREVGKVSRSGPVRRSAGDHYTAAFQIQGAKMNIGIDMDDVLTDALSGVLKVNPKWDGTRWDGGLTEEEVIAHWAKVGEVYNFWANLKPLPSFDLYTEELLYQAHTEHDLY